MSEMKRVFSKHMILHPRCGSNKLLNFMHSIMVVSQMIAQNVFLTEGSPKLPLLQTILTLASVYKGNHKVPYWRNCMHGNDSKIELTSPTKMITR